MYPLHRNIQCNSMTEKLETSNNTEQSGLVILVIGPLFGVGWENQA